MRLQHQGKFRFAESAILSGLQIVRQYQASDPVTMECGDVIADRQEHTVHLVIAPPARMSGRITSRPATDWIIALTSPPVTKNISVPSFEYSIIHSLGPTSRPKTAQI
jgi:hypothetical protein